MDEAGWNAWGPLRTRVLHGETLSEAEQQTYAQGLQENGMDEAKHKVWWPLHIRAARGETLTPEEQAVYEAGLQQMYAEENLDGNVERLRRGQQRIQELTAEYHRLQAQLEEMERASATLEARFDIPPIPAGVGN